jgi:hypothetical protein
VPLANVNNGVLKTLIAKLSGAGLGPKSIHNIVQVMEAVVASCVNENGEETYPRKWNFCVAPVLRLAAPRLDFEFADMPVIEDQHTPNTPSLTGDHITRLVASMKGQERMLCILVPACGLRIGELSGLEIKHFVGNVLQVEQTVWKRDVQARGKSKNFFRLVDLHFLRGDDAAGVYR